jgi:NAD(P)-dependent dehydrogenase (short-subunit alcohol dehydrogenase family)
MTLEGRVALVTGAGGQGMGRSIALTLARDGADIVLNYFRRVEHVEATAAAIEMMDRRVVLHRADVSDLTAIDALFAAAHETLGRIDIVVNNAGAPWKPQDVSEIEPAHLRRVLASEIEATYYLLRASLPGMRSRGFGRFVSIGGHMADDWRHGPPEAPLDYPLGKAARHWLTRTLAPGELSHGITINAVAPGPTPRFSHEQALMALRALPEGPGNTPQHVAETVAWLCSDRASRVTGAVIPIPGARPV